MFRQGRGNHFLTPARSVALLLVLALLAGCGQKGDLYRPGKPQKLAAQSEVSPRA